MKRIDVGSAGGRRPAPGYDVYTDIFQPDRPPKDGKFIICPMEDMSIFADKEFDFARCHHVIEHVNDPEKACSELIRIAKAGAITFPTLQAEIMWGRPDHNWFVAIDRGRLYFITKQHPSYGTRKQFPRCEWDVTFNWEGSFNWVIVE